MGIAVEQKSGAQTNRRPEKRNMTRVAVAGATGYAGRELIALLARHPAAKIVSLMSSGRSGNQPMPVSDSHPALRGVTPVPIQPLSLEALEPSSVDLVFLATPHEASHDLVPQILDRGLRIVDLSGAFRLKDSGSYSRWYGFDHHAAPALAEAVYGLPELNRAAIRKARLVANPGCYPTSAILALAPLLQAGVIDVEAGIICDAKSGATGAGRSLKDDLLFSSINENCRAYGFFKHRHIPETLQALNLKEESFTFTPHLLPLNRGLLSTIYARLRRVCEREDVARIFLDSYAQAPLVRVCEEGKLPEIQAVANSPYADIGFVMDSPTRRLVIVSAIDNLGKGAAGQAVQNMNLMMGHAEDAGLR